MYLQQTRRDALERNAIEKYHLPLQVVESTILALDVEPALQQAKQTHLSVT